MAETTPKPPPNLRVASSEDKECGNCSHYKETTCGTCMLDTGQGPICLPVNDEWYCDDWAKGSKGDVDADEDTTDASGGAKNVQDAERNLRAARRAAA